MAETHRVKKYSTGLDDSRNVLIIDRISNIRVAYSLLMILKS